ncbi:MAG: carbon-nitrogen hydrolase family protein [Methanothrix sp.]|nr:carbon-nitrogen hydrolase family protein [Methanothrix sp.]
MIQDHNNEKTSGEEPGPKVALVHAAICWKDKDKNITKLLALNEEAARSGSRIIVNTELATTGYAFESRREIAALTESIPGPATRAFGGIARGYGCYICIGLPERDARTGIFYNSAALIGPSGRVVARYRKASPAFKENLWAAKGNLPIPTVQTEFGALGLVICADSYSYRPARIAALQGTRMLLVPANWPPEHHNPEKFWRARALENGMYILACNRTGMDRIMDCNSAESFIIDPQGRVIKQTSSPDDIIIYGTLPSAVETAKEKPQNALGYRRPQCYGNIALDPYSYINLELLLGLPQTADFAAATLQFRSKSVDPTVNVCSMLRLIDDAAAKAAEEEQKIKLAVLPELSTTGPIFNLKEAERLSEVIPGITTDIFAEKARERNVFIVLGMAERDESDDRAFYNSCVLIGPDGIIGKYRKVHLSLRDRNWAFPGDGGFAAFDLPFARIGMLIGHDLMFPEAADSLAKLGADMLCVPALWENAGSKFIWEARLGEQMHLAIANQWGNFCCSSASGSLHALGESLLCNYSRYPEKISRLWSPLDEDAINIMRLGTKDAREKRFLENIDYGVLLDLGEPGR